MDTRRDLSIAIVGSGFSGIGLAIRLKQTGFTDLTIFEKANGIGGVWRDNTYPGAACDAPSHLYSYSFEPKPDWSRRFAEQPEILDYLQCCASKYGLGEHLRFGTEVTDATFDTSSDRWVVRTAAGDEHRFELLVSACGQLSRPAWPQLTGIENFGGAIFHSARWDHGHDLTGRRVAVIGNGASAIQFVPRIARDVKELHIFQRDVHWIGNKLDRVYPVWRRRLNRHFPLLQKLPRLGIFIMLELFVNPMLVSRRGRRLMSFPVRAFCHYTLRSVHDPDLRRTLTPAYEVGCKRMLVSSRYYTTLNQPNVHVVTEAITQITKNTVRTADDEAIPVDTIILATGFRSHDFVAPMQVTGTNGVDLTNAWKNAATAYLGLAVSGFPNFYLMYGPNTNVGSGSIVHMLESQITYIVQAAEVMALNRITRLDVRQDVLERYDDQTQQRLSGTVWNTGGCDSWYLTDRHRNTSNWPGRMLEYRRRTRRLDLTDYRAAPPDDAAGLQE